MAFYPGAYTKIVPMILPQAIKDDADFVGAFGDSAPVSVDTNGYEFATIDIILGATDIAIAELQLYHGDVVASGADDTDFSAITGATFSTLPSATDDNKVFRIQVGLADKKRYLCLGLKAGNGSTGTFAVANCTLSNARVGPIAAADMNCAGLVVV
jgi:hypothetical protein